MSKLGKIEIRKIVPVVAKVSAGKSKLLNVIYNINFLECKAGIGTKFVNLLRYNQDINQPCFYHLILKKEGEDYIFYKDLSEVYEGEKNIIEANKNINNKLYNEKEIKYENIFYMTEINDSPFIKDKEYLLTHDLCDIPGLSEYQSDNINKEVNNKNEETKNNEENNEKNELVNNDENKIENEINDDSEDEIYYKTEINNKTYLTEIFKIIKNYINGAIIILSVENYYFEENFEMIAKLHKVIKNDITNCLVLLNKMDLSTNSEKDIQRCKGEIIKHFPKFQTFNITLNTFIPLSVNQVQNELLMDKSFKHLIYYHFYNYISKVNKIITPPANSKSFINHLIDIIRTDKEIKIKEIISKIKTLNDSEINNEIKSIIKNIKDEFKGKDIKFGISENDINESDDEDEEDLEKNSNSLDDLNPSYIIKILYLLHKEKKLIPSLSEETTNLLQYFKKNKFYQKTNTNIKNQYLNKESYLIENMKSFLENLINKLSQSKIDVINIAHLINNITKTINFLNIYDSIYIPFLGASNAGKSTIINGIIGRDIIKYT